jgi:MYXO-CTERM domain-containing protein
MTIHMRGMIPSPGMFAPGALRSRLLPAAALGLFAFAAARARAGWPPPPDATAEDMKDPANWPNDPSYGYVPGKVGTSKSGQWPFYSFVPDRSPGAPKVRPGETAAGMSIDLAWRHTIGDDAVVIAVLDSGILWSNAMVAAGDELVDVSLGIANKAWLNRGELASHPPLTAAGAACAGSGVLAGFDCDGNGIFDVRDYAEHPGLEPAGDAEHPKGDRNSNGILDPSDLILHFSDGNDDDGNGYVDDICGWDFYKNDNDPWDDTHYKHGTSEASWAAAQTNDALGDAGVCPLCRFLPLRVGDSFIADAHDFSKAVLYSVDAGATVVQEALGTIDMTRFTQAAIDYAWKKNVLVVASMADENARHHNFPVTANHTLPVHAITVQSLSEDSTAAPSFLAFNNCTNFGAQNFLSASGAACSSEATGRVGGVSGLVYSMALAAATDPPLSPSEAGQIAMMTADDVDVPESREAESLYYWSQPGFDQRFGYGRVNANTAVEAVKQGRIPPEVDVVEPRWFDVLYRDSGPVAIRGTVRARRADTYDFRVEWAPGVQPLDEDFHLVTELQNVPGDTTSGDDEPLAEIDPKDIDTKHEPDPDSPFGENRYTITVRVRATAHYGGSIGDVKGELRRAYYVYEDPDLLPGFPLYLGDSLESSPKLADIDGDGLKDVIQAASGGELHVFSLASGKPKELDGFPFRTKLLDGLDGDAGRADYRAAAAYQGGVDVQLARETITATPAVADVDGDGSPEIAITTTHGTLHLLDAKGEHLPGWPVRLRDVPSCPTDADHAGEICMGIEDPDGDAVLKTLARGAFGSPVLQDMDGDGRLDLIQAAFDGHVHVYALDGEPLAGWPVRLHYEGSGNREYNRSLTTPAVADFNGDGTPDVLVGSNEKIGAGGGSGAFYLIDGRGNDAPGGPYLPSWPITMVSFQLFPVVGEGVTNSPIVADVARPGVPDGILHGNASAPLILPADPGAQSILGATPPNAWPERIDENGTPVRGIAPTSYFGPISRARTPDTMFPLFAQPSAGDLDQDGTPDVVTSGGSLSLAQNMLSSISTGSRAQYLLGLWSGKTGEMLPASPIPLEDFTFFNNQAIADLTGDGYPEVLTGTGGYYVHAVDACGVEAPGWPKFTGQWIIATTALGDLDGDRKLEVVVGTRSGWLYAWRTQGSTDGVIAWESFHHDNRNTGNYMVDLDQGVRRAAEHPLGMTEDGVCGPLVDEEQDEGCGCRAAGSGGGRPWLALLAVLVAVRPRRRRG